MRLLALLIAATAAAYPQGSAGDPLGSPDCARALAGLSAEEDVAIARRKASAPEGDAQPARLLQFQRAAALACLGAADATPPQPTLRPPVTVPGITLRPVPLPPAGRSAPLPDAVQQRPLLSITSCDALGCWASDGTRLQRQGWGLLGPRGLCSQLGAVLDCP